MRDLKSNFRYSIFVFKLDVLFAKFSKHQKQCDASTVGQRSQ